LNKTGLTGKYDFTPKWTPDEATMAPGGPKGSPDDAPPPESSGPSLFTAIQEQLGLKLEPQKAAMDVLVIQHVERPSEN
jgi:bla regulator protein blaR1